MASVVEEASSTASVMQGASFYCHACTRLHRTRAGEAAVAVAACSVCAGSLEGIVDVVEAHAFLDACHPEGPPRRARANAEPLPLVTVGEAGLTCAICLDELELGASAGETPCQHAFHPDCLAPWLDARGTCPVCRAKSVPDDDDAPADGLIIWDQQNGRTALGRRTAGRVHMVGIIDVDDVLIQYSFPPAFRPRRLGRLRGLRRILSRFGFGSRAREARREIV